MPKKDMDAGFRNTDAGSEDDILYIGMDFGTSRTSISASNGIRKTIASVVGYPKDIVAQKYLRQPVVFGVEALEKRLALELIHPIDRGVIRGSDKNEKKSKRTHTGMDAARELIHYSVELAEPKDFQKVYGVIGVPAQASLANKQALMDAASESLDAVMIVSEPFAVAYALNKLFNSLIIDIGAGTVDLCRVHGTIPTEDDQRTTFKAGDHIDNFLMQLVEGKYDGAQLTKNMVRLWKEEHGFVLSAKKAVSVEAPINGVPTTIDITTEMKKACEDIVPDILGAIRELVASYHPEFQQDIRNNIVLAGGCSQVADLGKLIEEGLSSLGGGKVAAVDDPIYAGADGSLKLAQDMPVNYWQQLG